MTVHPLLLRVCCLLAFGLSGLVGCGETLDTTRRNTVQLSVGEAVYQVVCERVSLQVDPTDVSLSKTRALCAGQAEPALGADPRLSTLHQNRARFVNAVADLLKDRAQDNTRTTENTDGTMGAQIKQFLTDLLPLYDAGVMRTQMGSVAKTIETLKTPEATQALATLYTRATLTANVVPDEYAPKGRPVTPLWHAVLRYDDADALLQNFLDVFGEGAPKQDVLRSWQTVASRAMAALPAPQATATAPPLLSCVMLNEAPHLATPDKRLYRAKAHADGTPVLLERGVTPTAPTPVDESRPFGEALASYDSGYSRDAYGRLMSTSGSFSYAYEDLNATPLAAGLRQGQALFATYAANTTTVTAPALHGELSATQTVASPAATVEAPSVLDLTGWLDAIINTGSGNEVFDAAHLANRRETSLWLGAADAMDTIKTRMGDAELLQPIIDLWDSHETEIAKLLHLGWQTYEGFQNADMTRGPLEPHNTLFDDMLDWAQQAAAVPGLFENIAMALQDPNTKDLGHLLAMQMRYKDRINYDKRNIPSYETVGDFVTPVDPLYDDVENNRSVFARLLHLVNDSNRLMLSSKERDEFGYHYAPGEFFDTGNAALFYLRSIVGRAELLICGEGVDPATFQGGDLPTMGLLAAEEELEEIAKDLSKKRGSSVVIGQSMGLRGMTYRESTHAEKQKCRAAYAKSHGIELASVAEHTSEELGGLLAGSFALTYEVRPEAAARMLFVTPDDIEQWNENRPFICADDQPQWHVPEAQQRREICPFINTPPYTLFDTPMSDERDFRTLHQGTLFAWELHGFHQAIAPVIEAFAKTGHEQLMLDLLVILHRHWPTVKSDTTQSYLPERWDFARKTGLSNLEPLLAKLLDNRDGGSDALGVLGNLAAALDGRPKGTLTGAPQGGLATGITALRAALAPVNPAAFGFSALQRGNGGPIFKSDVTPAHQLLALGRHVQTHTAAYSDAHPGFAATGRGLADTFLQTNADGTRLSNREVQTIVDVVLTACKEEQAENPAFNFHDLATEFLGSPTVMGGLRMLASLGEHPEARMATQAFMTYMFNEHLDALTVTGADLLQGMHAGGPWQSLLRAASDALDPDTGVLSVTLATTQKLRRLDNGHVMPKMLRNLAGDQDQEVPLTVFADIATQLNRVTPGSEAPLTATDYQAILQAVQTFMTDDKAGMLRLIGIVEQRGGPNAGKGVTP